MDFFRRILLGFLAINTLYSCDCPLKSKKELKYERGIGLPKNFHENNRKYDPGSWEGNRIEVFKGMIFSGVLHEGDRKYVGRDEEENIREEYGNFVIIR